MAAEEFDVREFPEVAVDDGFGALADEVTVAAAEDVGDEFALARFFAGGNLGEVSDTICFEGGAGALDGAGMAEWIARGADGSAEFHEALVEG